MALIKKKNTYFYTIVAAGRPKKSKKESSEDEKDDSDEDEPLNKKGKASFPTVSFQNFIIYNKSNHSDHYENKLILEFDSLFVSIYYILLY